MFVEVERIARPEVTRRQDVKQYLKNIQFHKLEFMEKLVQDRTKNQKNKTFNFF